MYIGATVEPFGSFVSNMFTRWGDLDISITILTGSHISNTAKKQKQSWLKDVQRALRSKGKLFHDLEIHTVKLLLPLMTSHNMN